jgi:hypothetical protein
MTYFDTQQQNPAHNPQFNPQQGAPFSSQTAQPYGAWLNMSSPQATGGYGLGQAAYGQQFGQYGGQPSIGAFGHNPGWGTQPQWDQQQQPQWGQQQQPQQQLQWGQQQQPQQQPQWGQQQQPQQWGGQQQRQLSQQDVSEVVRQLVPALPQILAQAQLPHAAIGYAAYGQAPRQLSQQDVNEVVRQILPMVPQIVGTLQGQPQLQYAAMQGGQGFGQQGLGQFGQGNPAQNFGAPFGVPHFQSAFGAPAASGQQQRQLTQQDVSDITRQLIGVIPQVIGNLQAFNQQRMI